MSVIEEIGRMAGLLILLIVPILAIIWAITRKNENAQDDNSIARVKESPVQEAIFPSDEKTVFLSENGITSLSKELTYTDSFYSSGINRKRGHCINFFIDQVSLQIAIYSNHGLRATAPFSKIIGCEIVTDSKVTGGVGRAVVGSVIAGETGALVGAMTAPEKIVSYKVVIYLNNAYDPMIEIPIIEEKKSTKSADYTNAVKFAESISATIKAIVYQNSKTARQALQ